MVGVGGKSMYDVNNVKDYIGYNKDDIEYLIGELVLAIGHVELIAEDKGIRDSFGKKFFDGYKTRVEFLKRKFLVD